MSSQNMSKRWYDKDPALSRAINQLREAPDKHQAQVALNIIKVIVEHQVEDPKEERSVDAIMKNVYQSEGPDKRRWYDINESLHSAMQLLNDCPEELQLSVIPSVASMIEQALKENL